MSRLKLVVKCSVFAGVLPLAAAGASQASTVGLRPAVDADTWKRHASARGQALRIDSSPRRIAYLTFAPRRHRHRNPLTDRAQCSRLGRAGLIRNLDLGS